ncbi:hypothetical protein D3C87_1044330 [compost metagenome]
MKKSVVMGMVLVATMSFSAAFAAPAGKGLFDRAMEGKAPLQQALYGSEVVKGADGKPVIDKATGKEVTRPVSLSSLPAEVRVVKQNALIDKITGEKSKDLREYVRSSENKSVELSRTDILENVLLAKNYVDKLPEGADKTAALREVDGVIKLISNSTRAKDRGDEATMTLVQQSVNLLKWSPAQRKNVTDIAILQDKYMMEGMESRAALEKAYSEVKGVTLEVAKKAVDKIKELCKV